MDYQLTITISSVATIDFETEKDARNWMDTWENQDYQSLEWSDDEATMMELYKGDTPIRVCYCEMKRST